MSFWVYILRCADGSYYTGHTDNLDERIAKHQAGEIEGYTSTSVVSQKSLLRFVRGELACPERNRRVEP